MDLISVIVPVYNVEKYLDRCFRSLLEQTYENIEIIAVDDGSTDRSGLLCDDYAKKDARIQVIHQKNVGLGFARNTGLEQAKGKYIAFVDGDDYIGKEYIQDLHHLILQEQADTCIGGYTKVYARSQTVYPNVLAGKMFRENVTKEFLPRMCGADNGGDDYIEMSVCMGLFSNEIIQKYHLRFVSERGFISEDLVFDFDYYPHSKGVCVSHSTDYYYCDNENSLTTKYRKDRFEKQLILYHAILKKAEELSIEELCRPRLNHTLVAIARYSIKLENKFFAVNGKQVAKQRIQAICENEELKAIWNQYDDKNLKRSSRIVNFMIRHRWTTALWFAMSVKNRLHI
jgi:glycosyltransferase EpsJ